MVGIKTIIGLKGQVVIPKQIREEIGLYPGEKIEFDLNDSEIIIRKKKNPIKLFLEVKKLANKKFTESDFKKIDWDKLYEEQFEEKWKKMKK